MKCVNKFIKLAQKHQKGFVAEAHVAFLVKISIFANISNRLKSNT